jgi:hypothetical protein
MQSNKDRREKKTTRRMTKITNKQTKNNKSKLEKI